MRARVLKWLVPCLLVLLLAGAWLLLHPAQTPTAERAARRTVSPLAHTNSTVSKVPAAAGGPITAKGTSQINWAKTNRYAYRLTNTTQPIGKLVDDPHAILLANALIDTRKPLNLAIPKQLRAPGNPGAYIVQSRGPTTAAFRAALAQAGGQIVSYIPNNAYLVRFASGQGAALAGNPLVQAVIPYEPYYKISANMPVTAGSRTASSASGQARRPAGPSLLTLALKQAPLPSETYLTLGLFASQAPQTIKEIEKLGGRIVERDRSPFGPVVRVRPPANWTALAALPGVQIVEPYCRRIHANDLSRVMVGVAANTQVATNYLGLTGAGVLVEVNDSGIDQKHPDFETDGSLPFRVFGDTPLSLMDTNGHGTHVAGIIAGDGFESETVTNVQGSLLPATNGQFRGMAPLADLFSMTLNGHSDQALQEMSALTNALISNNSWNNNGDNAYDLAAAGFDAATRDALPGITGSQPVLFVFSAGNDGGGDDSSDPGDGTADTIMSPATAKDVITVGAIQEHRDITNLVSVITANPDGTFTTNTSAVWQPETSTSFRVAGFSARGNVGIGTEGAYGRFKPDVVAPGTFVVSTRSEQWDIKSYFYINLTNHSYETYSNIVTQPGSLWANVFPDIPNNTVGVSVGVGSNPDSPVPLPDLPIFVGRYTSANVYDFIAAANPFMVPGDANAAGDGFTIPEILSTEGFWGFNYGVSNNTAQPISYNVTTDVITTNNPGDYNLVLSNLDQSIGTNNPDSTGPGPYYRYETGTSMSAADVSGVLALMQQYFQTNFNFTPSPALMKAALINGARVSNPQVYNLEVTNSINHEGWGLVNLTNSLPGIIADQFNTPCDDFFVDQSSTNALATGDSHTYLLKENISTNADPRNLPLRVTLVWTDPPGNPAAAVKLVNSLELVVTNLDDPTNPVLYYGNDIPSGALYNNAESVSNTVSPDVINNVQNVFIYPQPGTNYSITVIGRQVNVNAVTTQTNNVVQDYALVVSCGDGGVTNAFTVTDHPGGIVSNPTGAQDVTFVTTTNQPLLNQMVGANTPLLGTNTVEFGSTNALVTLGMTNQWHFYVVTNNAVDSSGSTADVTNATFITFLPDTLSVPREGVFANSLTNATRPQADIDLYVASGPDAAGLTNLDPTIVSNCVNGTQVGNSIGGVFYGASLSRGGTEFVVDTNSIHGQVYYIGVKSEDQMASEYGFIPIFTSTPPSIRNPNGDEVVNGLNVPVPIPDGSPALPGVGLVFGVGLYPIQIERVVVTNQVWHQNFGDLIGTLTLNGSLPDVLNNHDSIGNTINLPPMIYDDSGQNDILGARLSDGPGSLDGYVSANGSGVWMLAEADDSLTQVGDVQNFSLLLQPHRAYTGLTTNTIPAHSWLYDYVDVGPGYTNLSVYATNLPPVSQPPLQLYLNVTNRPDFSNYLFEVDLTNSPPGQAAYPAGANPGNMISYGPPLQPARYWFGVYNPDDVSHQVVVLVTLGGQLRPIAPANFLTNGPSLLNDAVTTNAITITNTDLIASANVGLVVAHPRISDLTFTLVSPGGQRVLLMENRGGDSTNGAGGTYTYTNVLNGAAINGGAPAKTNYLAVDPHGGVVPITYNFYTAPDEMTVYAGTNNTDPNGPDLLLDTGFTNNPPDGAGGNVPETLTVPYPPGLNGITIIMNQFGNPSLTNGVPDDWTYTAGVAVTNFQYLMFTDDTNLASLPIKFAVPPFSASEEATNYTLSDFEQATNGLYRAPTNIYDPFGGWTMPTNRFVGTNLLVWSNNLASVVTAPSDVLGGAGTNLLALADGTIQRSIPTVPGREYNVTFWYRGPGIAGWWRGEGNANDSSAVEDGNNGSLIGTFNFPAGEVGQAFEMEDVGQSMEFAGTNTYVQIPQSPSLDAGAGGGLTVEGWINPTNVTQQMPLVEWLAKVPVITNSPDTNFSIEAGPFLDRGDDHYYYLLAPTNWTTSEYWATKLGGHLATVDTANEQNWIRDEFGAFGGTNRNLWIGLTNSYNGTTFAFGWSSGTTNLYYTNWDAANGQPDNGCGTSDYTFMTGSTNGPGLWTLADNNGVDCSGITHSNIYGVVEVTNLQPNGVQFWISVTNTPGTTNGILDSAGNLITNGCLYANLIDTTNGSHEIHSAPGLIQSNLYQYVALTYDTNSGLARLYYNGTNVATTNLGVFFPKTGGDVLLGKDMSLATNNYYGGEMDEMSIYRRALSAAEIAAIYNASVFSTNGLGNTNGLIGKFDPSVTPAYGLAEARVAFGTVTNVIFGLNNQWREDSFTFTATSNAMPLQISGVEPGILLDNFAVSGTPLTNLYYFPEQSLDELDGESAAGTWTLQIWDNRANAFVTPADAQLLNWVLQFTLQTNVLESALPVGPNNPSTVTVPPGQTVYLSVAVPSWASVATNVLVSASAPVDLLFNPTNKPTGSGPGDLTLLTGATSGIGSPNLAVNSPLPLTASDQAGTSYYLGVRNSGAHAVTATVAVDFDITGLSNGVPVSGTLNTTNRVERYFAFDVSSNAYEATFQLLHLSGNADLVVRKGPPLPTLTSSDYGSFNPGTADETIYVQTNSAPVPLSPGRWYLGVFNRDSGPVNYTVLAKELDMTNGVPGYTVIDLTNRVPFNFTAGPGTALTNFFRFNVANTVFLVTNTLAGGTNSVTTNTVGSIRFELYNLSGNGDLTLQTNAPPLAPPFFESSQEPGTSPELITIRTNGVVTNLLAQWYLGVPNHETNEITYTIVAELETNLVFPAFPTAEGAGADAVGGRFGSVYHVTSLADSGAGTLRDAVSAPNRTVVFDVPGTIDLLSPLIITNSFLTIAGQTAPGGGITVAGNMTAVQSAHDVILRDVRFRPVASASGPAVVWYNGFEGGVGNSGPGAGTYFAGGWYVTGPGYVDVLTNGTFSPTDLAYQGGYCIDLNGASPSGVMTNVTTVPGVTYTLHFAYAKNPGTNSAQAAVVVNGNPLATITANQANSWADLGWQTASYVFTATSPSTQLAFISTNTPGASDVLLDAVSLTRTLSGTPLSLSSFEGASATNYTSGQAIANSGWTVLTNQVSLVTDPVNAYDGHSNLLALANGVISNTFATVPGKTYALTFAYRGPGMAAWWRGENSTVDSINGNNGTANGALAYTNGEVGQAFQLDDTTSYVSVPASTSLNVGTGPGFTLESWINPDAHVITVSGAPIIEWDAGTDGLQLWCSGPNLFSNIKDTANNPHIIQTAALLVTNQFQDVAVTYSKNTGIATLYINGTNFATANFGNITPQSTYPVNIGRRTAGVSAGTTYGGAIDELSVYNRGLSASEIKAIYQKGSSGKFDRSVFNTSPSQSLAEAQVSLAGQSAATIFGSNTQWQVGTFTFVATQNETPVTISGVEPGVLLDSVVINAGDSLLLTNVSDVVADHISTSWSTNNDLSVLNSTNVTVQWSIMADSLYNTNEPHGNGSRLRYGNGALTFHHNLYADNYSANPRLGDDLKLDFVNNVVYNWGAYAGFSTNDLATDPLGFTNELNYVANYLIAGTNSVMTNIAFWSGTTNTWIFQTNNFMDSNTNGILDGADTGWQMFTNKYTPFQVPFPPLAVSIDEAYRAYERVLDFAGEDMDKRDAVDTNIVAKVRDQTGTLVSSAGTLPALTSALPYLDTDQDGLPDFWEKTFTPGLVFVPSNTHDRNGDGYTDLEEYNNWLAGPHALTVTNTPVGVDLMQLFGKTGNLSFFVTNAVQGFVYLTNVLDYTNVSGDVIAETNTGVFSNSFAIFTPTNNLPVTTNYSGYASFDVYVTNNATIAHFGPVPVSVLVSAVPVRINSNMPPVITPLVSGVLDPTNSGGSDFYSFNVTTNAVGALFAVTNISVPGGLDLLAKYGSALPSLSDYDYISTNTANEYIFVGPDSTPVPLTAGVWHLAVVNVNPTGDPVSYNISATELFSISPPVFLSPTNTDVFTNLETTLFATNCVATDPNTPPLPLTFALVSGPTNMTVSSGGAISWTPTEAQGPSTNSILVSASNGAASVTNSFTVIVEESNLPPVLPAVPNQLVVVPGGTLVVTNTATDPDIPANPLTYRLLTTVTDTNAPAIDTNNGVITWAPTLADVGTNYLFTTIVTDTNQWAVNAKSLSATNSFYVTVLPGTPGGQPQTNTVPAGGIKWLTVNVPTNAVAATNILLYATNLPVNVWFSTNLPPTTTNANDVILMPDATNGVSVLTVDSSPTNIVPGGTYFLGVQNLNALDVGFGLEVDFRLATPTNAAVTNVIRISSIVYTNFSGTNGFLLTWFAPSNDLFQVQWTGSLQPASWSTFTNIVSYNVAAFTSPTNTQFNFFDDGSQTGGFGPLRLYRLLLLQATNTLTLPLQTNLIVSVSAPVTVTNTAVDSLSNAILTYNLLNAPANASISTNGVIFWTNATPAGVAQRFITMVKDNGLPPVTASNTFTVFVRPFPAITNVTVTATNTTLAWVAPTNDQFNVQWTTNLDSPIVWTVFPQTVTSLDGVFTFTDTNAPVLMKFYQLILLP